ncbi:MULTISPECIES: hypothetical protein [Psychrilyobacter]|uniref:Initiator Rep protein domain-containing protein n=1 Tax=Psychrilyobacter piezotolerans TaxID=2293438 RepID=A0ABX9KJ61_9FUSO|nr:MULTISPECIES: hypothetical protein [Psychrilyobacter]MCS5422446.1 hypothetical protein [Psychrilyobacter sp. S5]NDI77401.1 hypothetical protein [Psychrilyobacter piezotolerans]RDE63705.1 hypothetical protein DV867_04840 [Psychrilyobacter sp. S5]REI42049.1 hypothetical protein DYH56_04840 [Psychrilyobacter piezotolerans]
MSEKKQGSLLEILEIGNKNDLSIDIKSYKPKTIPTKTVSLYLEDMDIRDTINQPFLFIILPFFTSKRQRNVNLVYEIANAGIKFGSSLSTDNFEGIRNQQPSDFEKNVFYFILYKFQEILADDPTKEYITFNIEEVIDYLGLKFSMKYYRKMEETLYNLQATTYKILIRNKKAAGNIIREVYKEPLNLVKYEKFKEKNIKTNKMKVYYKVRLDHRIIEELRIKHYSIFDRHQLNVLRKSDRAAEKIYQFLSMKRFANTEGEFRIETLATIIPLTLKSRIRKVLKTGEIKEYEVSKMKQVMKRINKSFDALVEKGYLLTYEVYPLKAEKSYAYRFKYNVDKDGECHISDYILKGKKKKALKNSALKQIRLEVPNEVYKTIIKDINEMSEAALKAITKAKRNIFVSKNWNKRAENKIIKLYNEEGEKVAIHILDILYSNLKTDISKTLVAYINGILKNVKGDKDLLEDIKTSKREDKIKRPKIVKEKQSHLEIIEAEIVEPPKPKVDEEVDLNNPIYKVLLELYEKMEEKEKEELLVKAKKMFEVDSNIEKFMPIHQKIFKSIEKIYILKILKKEKGL